MPPQAEVSQLISLINSGHHAEVETRARTLIQRYPNFATGWKLLGGALHMQGKDSLPTLLKTAELFPNDADAHNNLGNVLHDLGHLDKAEASYRRAIKLNPDFAMAHYNLATVLHKQGQMNEAVACCRHALKLNPDYVEAHNNLGNFLKDIGQIDEAAASFRRALKIDPDNTQARSNLLFVLNYASKFSPEFCLEEARQYGRITAKLATSPFTAWQCEAQPQRLRVGIVSSDLYNHPVGYFLENVLVHFDPERIELIAYAAGQEMDDLTSRIKPSFSEWKQITGKSNAEAARLIHADGIHVLLDLSGHTGKNRLPIFAWKPAPVQASWLGYFATTGVAEMDYFLADAVGVPEALRGHFTESIWYLPDTRLCFTPPKNNLPVTPLPALSNGKITFGCFQNLAKLGDDVLEAWGKIFSALPNAKLRIQCKQMGDALQVEQMTQRLKRFGIEPERVSTHGPIPHDRYLAAHAEVDIILDTFPYPGGTTTCEALWMGVPTLTLAGNTLLARQGASLLMAAGLEQWIAQSKEEYIAKAIAFASDRDMLCTLRNGLRQQVLASPLFDAPRFATNFEDALWNMWQARLARSNGNSVIDQ